MKASFLFSGANIYWKWKVICSSQKRAILVKRCSAIHGLNNFTLLRNTYRAQSPAAARNEDWAVGDGSWREEAMNWYQQRVHNQGPGDPARWPDSETQQEHVSQTCTALDWKGTKAQVFTPSDCKAIKAQVFPPSKCMAIKAQVSICLWSVLRGAQIKLLFLLNHN